MVKESSKCDQKYMWKFTSKKSGARGRPREAETRRAVAKEGVRGGVKPPPWGSEVWKSSEVWNGGTEEWSSRSTGRVGGFIPYCKIHLSCIIINMLNS